MMSWHTTNRALEKSKTRRRCTRYARRKKTTLISSRFRKTRRSAYFVLYAGFTRTNLAVNGLCQKCARKYCHVNFKRFTGACRPCRTFETQLLKRDAARDLNAELLESINQMNAGQIGRVSVVTHTGQVIESPVAKARIASRLSQSLLQGC